MFLKTLNAQKNTRGHDLSGPGWKAYFSIMKANHFAKLGSTLLSIPWTVEVKYKTTNFHPTEVSWHRLATQLTLTFDLPVEGSNRKRCCQYMQKLNISFMHVCLALGKAAPLNPVWILSVLHGNRLAHTVQSSGYEN